MGEMSINEQLAEIVNLLQEPIDLTVAEAQSYDVNTWRGKEIARTVQWEAARLRDARYEIERALKSRMRRG